MRAETPLVSYSAARSAYEAALLAWQEAVATYARWQRERATALAGYDAAVAACESGGG